MRTATGLTLGLLLALSACGGDGDDAAGAPAPAMSAPAGTAASTVAASSTAKRRTGTRIVVDDSQFGSIVWGPKRQAVYVFERDRPGESRCYGECARLWPPVYTKGRPRGGPGIDASLLGVTERRDGRKQVTYDGRPLYYYVNEGPGEVRCHNVFLNGGLWWVVDATGEPLP